MGAKPDPKRAAEERERAAQALVSTLSSEERLAAERAGMTPERYARLKQVRTLDDWNRLNEREGTT